MWQYFFRRMSLLLMCLRCSTCTGFYVAGPGQVWQTNLCCVCDKKSCCLSFHGFRESSLSDLLSWSHQSCRSRCRNIIPAEESTETYWLVIELSDNILVDNCLVVAVLIMFYLKWSSRSAGLCHQEVTSLFLWNSEKWIKGSHMAVCELGGTSTDVHAYI